MGKKHILNSIAGISAMTMCALPLSLCSCAQIKDISIDGKPFICTGNQTTFVAVFKTTGGKVDETVKWSIVSSDAHGCTIDENTGLFTAGQEKGTIVTIRATPVAFPNFACDKDITIISHIKSIKISGDDKIAFGNTKKYVANIETYDKYTPLGVTWSVNSTSGTTIDAQGNLTAGNYNDNVSVIATSIDDPNIKASFEVWVIPPIEKIIVNGPSSISYGDEPVTYTATVQLVDPDASTDVEWSLDDSQYHTGSKIDSKTGLFTPGEKKGLVSVWAHSVICHYIGGSLTVSVGNPFSIFELNGDDALAYGQSCKYIPNVIDKDGKPLETILTCDVGTTDAIWDSATKTLTAGETEGDVVFSLAAKGYEHIPKEYTVHIHKDSFKYEYNENEMEAIVTGVVNRKYTNISLLETTEKDGVIYKITKIKDRAFWNVSVNVQLDNANNLVEIGEKAFSYTSLKKVFLPKSVRKIGSFAFSWSSLTDFVIEEGSQLIEIGNDAINDASMLEKINLENATQLTYISKKMFSYDEKLTSIIIPNGIKTIGDEAFNYCYRLAKIKYLGTIEEWRTITKGSDWHHSIKATEVECSNGSCSLDP